MGKQIKLTETILTDQWIFKSTSAMSNNITQQQGDKFVVWDAIDGDLSDFDSFEDIKKYLKDNYTDPEEGIHPDIESIRIFKEVAAVRVIPVDGKNTHRIHVIPIT